VARNLAEQKKDEIILNRAGVLLFARNPYRWFSRADVRFLRYEGTVAGLEPPVFEEYAFMFRVTLRNNLEKRQLRQTATPRVDDKRLADLNERQKKL
jgi:predicted HTH transcriptional regulator